MIRFVFAVLVCAGIVQAQQTWDQVPLVYPESGSARRTDFDSVWRKARTSTVRLCVIGDSQETLGASGDIYLHYLQAAFGLLYGNIPETYFTGPTFAGGGAPAAQYISCSNAQALPHGLDGSLIPPSIFPAAHTSQTYGALFLLQHDQANSRRTANLQNSRLFDVSGRIDLQVLAMRRLEPSGQVRVRIAPQSSPSASYFAPVIDTRDTSDAELAAGGAIEPRLYTFTNLPLAGQAYHQVYVKGSDPTLPTTIIGARFVNRTRPQGVAITSFSAGGYTAVRWLQNHSQTTDILRALQFDVFMICMGTNDAFGSGRNTMQFKADVLGLINIIRKASPNSRIILRVDPLWPDQANANYDRYAGVSREIADSLPSIIVLNHRRGMHLLGHVAANESATGLVDRGVWMPLTVYMPNDYVAQYGNGEYVRYWKCIQAHTSGASYAVDGPSMSGGHLKWVPWRWMGKSNTDSAHLSEYGQERQAWIDVLLLTGGGAGECVNTAIGLEP